MKIGIYGYGNLGAGVEAAVTKNDDIELFGIFTRRDPSKIKSITGAKVYKAEDVQNYKNEIDVLIICGGSATDLPVQTPCLAKDFNVVDSFDTHANIPKHFSAVDAAARENSHAAIISCGWDPGMFSVNRVYMESILPGGSTYTFWGRGVSQGHSDAVRRIPGVADARQYTVPVEQALEKVRNGEAPQLTTRMKHTRECFVAAEEGADKEKIEHDIKTMPNYFDEYDTTVTFISQEEMERDHSTLPHGGCVIRTGRTGINDENGHTVEYNLKLDSNPQFTSSILVCCARALNRIVQRGQTGAFTMLDIAPADLSPLSPQELRAHSL